MFYLHILGDPSLIGPDGPVSGRAAYKRRIALLAGFALPLLLVALGALLPGAVALVTALLAVPLVGLGLAVERWLFFAEAKHVVTLYYGESKA